MVRQLRQSNQLRLAGQLPHLFQLRQLRLSQWLQCFLVSLLRPAPQLPLSGHQCPLLLVGQ